MTVAGKNCLDSPAAGDLSHLRTLLDENEWWKWQRSQGSIIDGISAGATIKAAVKSADNSRMLVYYPEINSATIRNDLGRSAIATWFDPSNGNTSTAGNFNKGQSRALTPPDGWEDAVLILKLHHGLIQVMATQPLPEISIWVEVDHLHPLMDGRMPY